MTVPVTVERNNYTGNGTTATYAYGFRITAQTHLKVTVADEDGAETELAIGTDYTVTGVGVKTGGNIILVDNGQDWIDDDSYLATGWDMSIRHYVPLTQSTDIRNQGTFYPEIHEDAFDYLMWAIKQQQDELNRCVKAGETVTGVTPVFPAPEDGKSLVWSGTSGAMVNSNLKGEKGDTGAMGATGPSGADGVFTEIASQAEAEAGTNETKGMNPLRTAQAIAAKKCTGAEIDTGTDDAKFVTPKAIADSALTSETAWTDYSATSTIVGWSSFSTKKLYTKRVGGLLFYAYTIDGTSNAITASFTLPVAFLAGVDCCICGYTMDNGTATTGGGRVDMNASSATVNLWKDMQGAGWTNSGRKYVYGQGFIVVA